MGSGREVRLIAFRSSSESAVLDGALRADVLLRIAADSDICEAFVARHGPSDPGARLIVTVHRGAPVLEGDTGLLELSALSALDPMLFDPKSVELVQRLPVAFSARFERPEPPRILRVFDGTVHPGRLDEYVARASEGTEIDGRTIDGLCSLTLSTEPPDHFVTVSAWRDWTSIERATGGNVRQPMATRHGELIARGDAAHYELIGEVHESVATPTD